MKQFYKFLFFIKFFYLIFFINTYANEIRYLDINYIINNSEIGIASKKKINLSNNENIRIIKDEQNTIESISKDLENKKKILTNDQFSIELNDLQKKIKLFNEKKEILSKQINKLRTKETDELLTKINPLIEQYMKDNSIVILLNKESIYISKNNYDITEVILNLVNNKYK